MQPQQPELSFQQLKRDINLVDLVLTLGYDHNVQKSGHSTEKGKFHVFDYKGNGGLDRVIVYKAPGGDWLYFNPSDDRDKGSVIDFVKFRVENPKVPSITATPGKSVWFDVIDNCRRFVNLPAPQREHPQIQKTIQPIAPGEGFNSNLDKCRVLDDTRYLNNRGLNNETLNNPLFKGRILNHVHTGKTKAGDTYSFTNTAFPQYYKNRVVGLEIKANGFKGQAADSLNASSLWLSNTPERAKMLIVSESAIDSLSHYQINKVENAIYASTSGNLTENKLFEMKRLVQDHNLSTIRLALDNNKEGHIFDTQLLAGLANEANPTSILRNQPSLLTVGIHSADPKPIMDLVRAVKNYNQGVTEGYQEVAGSLEASQTLNSALISSNQEGKTAYQFHVPKEAAALSAFNQALLKSLPLIVKVEIHKSQANDWNDELRAGQRGPAQQPRLIAEQRSAVPAPRAAGGGPTPDVPKPQEKRAPEPPKRGMKM